MWRRRGESLAVKYLYSAVYHAVDKLCLVYGDATLSLADAGLESFCIYCHASVSPRGQKDHVIPAALGECENDLRFRHICDGCNQRISPGEQQILHCGPESLHRIAFNPPSRRRGHSPTPKLRHVHGSPPPRIVIFTPDGPELAKPLGPADFERLDQVVLESGPNGPDFAELHPDMRPEQLRAKLARMGFTGESRWRLVCGESKGKVYESLIMRAYPEAKLGLLRVTPPGPQAVSSQARFEIKDFYFRAIAKIAFHYYLTRTSRFRGDEEQFKAIRDFIMFGGDRDQCFTSTVRFRLGILDRQSAQGIYSHFVAAAEPASGEVLGYVHLFAGWLPSASEYHISLGTLHSNLVYPESAWAHQYSYRVTCENKNTLGTVAPAPFYATPQCYYLIRFQV